MQDTRKDKRAPVSLKVKYKSATLEEFVEQYSRDISLGGIFIKSKQPMPVGTLLKFELQLKDESKLIQGVGRVVWKRDPSEATSEDRPAGMGIKFIKMDPESRKLVEQIVAQRGEQEGMYEAGGGERAEGEGEEEVVESTRAKQVRSQTPTMQFFPTSVGELPPPEERTQVRQASEFLAAALLEGGAS
ncbi:MAG: TIGR02266 family protein, partial [Deltaproteobacteria bacterium]|nr:TIGR02266 family protein [Deltaproteobacteria bacterium]